MRHYHLGSLDGDFEEGAEAGSRYSKPVVFVMANNDGANSSISVSWCRGNKLKLFALLMVLLLMVQYLFGASVYNIRIFDYNIAQIYVWSAEPNMNLRSTTVPSAIPTTAASLVTSINSSSIGVYNATNSDTITSSNNATTTGSSSSNDSLPPCPVLPPVLVGPIKVWFDYPSYEQLQKQYPDLEPGGHGKPKECVSRHKVAIIIPYRDREKHLRGFLHNMHSLLNKQQLDYAIYVVEQVANQTFNRAKLMNIGFVEATKQYSWQCAIFHDVDLLPEDDRNIYSCPEQPRHMSAAVDKFGYRLPYSDIFGGISALTVDQFRTVNGFSNDYWGWGGEDDDMASRVKHHKYRITRYPVNVARYKMIKHVSDKQNPVNACRYNLMYKVNQRWSKDGLSNLNYRVVSLEKRPLYTWILVDLLEEESRQRLADEKVCAKKG